MFFEQDARTRSGHASKSSLCSTQRSLFVASENEWIISPILKAKVIWTLSLIFKAFLFKISAKNNYAQLIPNRIRKLPLNEYFSLPMFNNASYCSANWDECQVLVEIKPKWTQEPLTNGFGEHYCTEINRFIE